MADPHPSTDFATRLWRGLRTMIGAGGVEPTLRESLEEAIDEHVGEPADRDDLSAVERTMLKNLLHFGERLVDDAAVPRADIVAFDVDDRFADLVELFREAGHSRLPVFEGSLDNVVGMIHIKDVYTRIATTFDDAISSKPFLDFDVRSLLRTVLFVPSSMRVLDLLARMRSGRTHMAIVVDEFGGTDGLVTIEDLVEEIVGDIEDEHDEDGAKLLQAIGDDLYEADARLELSELEETTGHVFAAEKIGGEVDTLGGMVFMLAGRVPAVGEMIAHPSGWRFEVIDGDPRMVRRLRLYPPVPVV
jgi:CBS domain containing-hemolysin-like protein